MKSRLNAPPPRGRRNGSQGKREAIPAVAGTSQKPSQRPLGPSKRLRRSEKVSAVAGTSQKPLQRPPGKPKRLRRSENGFLRSRQLSKAVSTPPGAVETTPEKREGFPRWPAKLKSRLIAPRGRRNGSGEARRFPAVAGTPQKPLQCPPGTPKRLRRSKKISRGSRHPSKAASTPPRAAETAPGKREGFPR